MDASWHVCQSCGLSSGNVAASSGAYRCSRAAPRLQRDLQQKSSCAASFSQHRRFALSPVVERRKQRSRRRGFVQQCRASSSGGGKQDYYTLLGLQTGATDKEIKQAYRKLALKYHPDVNKAADAQERFLDIKMAYQTLSDPKSRQRYDWERTRTGSGGFGDFDLGNAWDNMWGRETSSKKKEEEEFYGFGDLFKDIEADLKRRADRVKAGKTKSLWEELADLGEEFVEFLEKELDIKDDNDTNEFNGRAYSGSASSTRRVVPGALLT
eukprot:jgi/Chlat1/2245/Chrsp17S02785